MCSRAFLDPRASLRGTGGGAEYRVIPHQFEASQDGSEPGQAGGQGEGAAPGLKLRQVHGDRPLVPAGQVHRDLERPHHPADEPRHQGIQVTR